LYENQQIYRDTLVKKKKNTKQTWEENLHPLHLVLTVQLELISMLVSPSLVLSAAL
jgi:ribosomal protein L28